MASSVNPVEICKKHNIKKILLQKLGIRVCERVLNSVHGREIVFEEVRCNVKFQVLEAFLDPETIIGYANKVRAEYLNKFNWKDDIVFIE